MLWDIFCKVIDNHGDIGVCWRLSAQLAARGAAVRLWVDDASALAWMAPQRHPGVQVLPWNEQLAGGAVPGDVAVEAFGCELEPGFQAALARRAADSGRQPVWLNLEYLSAETFVQRSHELPSPVLAGPAAGLTKYFFYPGFGPGSGGLLREDDLLRRQARFDADRWLQAQGIRRSGRLVSLFCYEPERLEQLLAQFACQAESTLLLVTAGRAAAAVRAVLAVLNCANPSWNRDARLAIAWLPLLSQADFDHLLWACDLNFVRGEDSLVRALWAGKPMVWQAYPQQDGAHKAKLDAFLDWIPASESLRAFHLAWNGLEPQLPAVRLDTWAPPVRAARLRLLTHEDLATQLGRFAASRLG